MEGLVRQVQEQRFAGRFAFVLYEFDGPVGEDGGAVFAAVVSRSGATVATLFACVQV